MLFSSPKLPEDAHYIESKGKKKKKRSGSPTMPQPLGSFYLPQTVPAPQAMFEIPECALLVPDMQSLAIPCSTLALLCRLAQNRVMFSLQTDRGSTLMFGAKLEMSFDTEMIPSLFFIMQVAIQSTLRQEGCGSSGSWFMEIL